MSLLAPEQFALRCWARAQLYQIGDLELHPAVDFLQELADQGGLIAAHGQDRVQEIMANAFAAVRDDLDDTVKSDTCVRLPEPTPSIVPDEEPAEETNAAGSSIKALVYELSTGGIAQLKDANCQQRLTEISKPQLRQLLAALVRLQPKHSAISDDLILALDSIGA